MMKSTAKKHESKAAEDCTSEPSSGAPDHNERIATAAYYKAEARGFTPGQEMDDWLAAEAELGKPEAS
jgi:hypothetical protein